MTIKINQKWRKDKKTNSTTAKESLNDVYPESISDFNSQLYQQNYSLAQDSFIPTNYNHNYSSEMSQVAHQGYYANQQNFFPNQYANQSGQSQQISKSPYSSGSSTSSSSSSSTPYGFNPMYFDPSAQFNPTSKASSNTPTSSAASASKLDFPLSVVAAAAAATSNSGATLPTIYESSQNHSQTYPLNHQHWNRGITNGHQVVDNSSSIPFHYYNTNSQQQMYPNPQFGSYYLPASSLSPSSSNSTTISPLSNESRPSASQNEPSSSPEQNSSSPNLSKSTNILQSINMNKKNEAGLGKNLFDESSGSNIANHFYGVSNDSHQFQSHYYQNENMSAYQSQNSSGVSSTSTGLLLNNSNNYYYSNGLNGSSDSLSTSSTSVKDTDVSTQNTEFYNQHFNNHHHQPNVNYLTLIN